MTIGGGSERQITARVTLVCQGSTSATRALAFPRADDALDGAATAALPRLRERLGWRAACHASEGRASVDTANALATTVDIEPDLRECDYGRWAGKALTDVGDEDPNGVARWLGDIEAAPHGGESIGAMQRRVSDWLERRTDAPDRVLAVVPPAVVRAAVVVALRLPAALFWQIDATPLGVTRLSAQNGRWRLMALNASN